MYAITSLASNRLHHMSTITIHGMFRLSVCSVPWLLLVQVFFAIAFSAIGIANAQMAFPDITKASGAVKRVFSVIDRMPAILSNPTPGKCCWCCLMSRGVVRCVVAHTSLLICSISCLHRDAVMHGRGTLCYICPWPSGKAYV